MTMHATANHAKALPSHAPRPSSRLKDQVAVVYGGGTSADAISVGHATAFAYAQAGAHVAVIDIVEANAQRTCDRIGQLGVPCLALQSDVTDADSVSRATAKIIERFGRIDILHNNVGTPQLKAFAEFSEHEWLRGMQINCLGAATTIQKTMPYMLASGRGVITNVSSVASIRYTTMNYAVYSTAKAALNQLTVAVALEYAARNIRANAILPGLLDTGMGRSLGSGDVADNRSRAERSPMKFEGDAWDVANAALYLASSEARYVTGHLLIVDGGLSARC